MVIELTGSLEGQETNEAKEIDRCLIDGAQLSTHEFSAILEETIPPEVEQIITYRKNVLGAIQTADTARSTFQTQKQVMVQNKTYIKTEKELKTTITKQFTEMVDLKTRFVDYCSQKITQLDNQYWHIRNDLLPNTTDNKKRLELERMCKALLEAKELFEELKSEGSRVYSDARMLLKNKIDTRKLQLIEEDPYKRYDREDRKKARELVKSGTPRSPANALKYLGGGPINKGDRGKCGITDQSIANNERIMDDIQRRAQARSRKKTEILRRDPKEPDIDIPDMSDDLIGADQIVKNVMDDLIAQKIDVSRLTKSQS